MKEAAICAQRVNADLPTWSFAAKQVSAGASLSDIERRHVVPAAAELVGIWVAIDQPANEQSRLRHER